MARTIRFIFYVIFSTIRISSGLAQTDSAQTLVSVSSILTVKQIPQNRTVDFIVRIVWEGTIESVEVGELMDPVFTNLDVVGTAASNQVTGISGGQKSVKEIVYTMKPKSLGMAYIEPVSLSYTDNKTGLVHFLRTRRMNVEVVSPLPENRKGPGIWLWVLFGAAFTGGMAIGGWFFLKQKKLKMVRENAPVQSILEEDFLTFLKDSVDLKDHDRNKSFSALSKLFRRYLSDKYGIAASSATTEELIRELQERGTDEGLIRKCEGLFKKADVIKFSGKDASQAELDEAYTTVETVLESRLADERERFNQLKAEEEKKKSKGLKRIFSKRVK